MKVTEEMILLTIRERNKLLKEYVNFDWNKLYFLSDAEEYIKRIKPIVDDMYLLLEEYKKEQKESKK